MLTDTEVLATGSLKGLISGKHFNRCKRLHPLLALAFEKLHFFAFLELYDKKTEVEEFFRDQRIARLLRLVCTRDLTGRLVVLAVKKDLDLPFIFQYPLTPVPLSMGNPDETMAKTDKSNLLDLLE